MRADTNKATTPPTTKMPTTPSRTEITPNSQNLLFLSRSSSWRRVSSSLPIAAWVEAGFGVLSFDYRGHGKAAGARADCNQWDDYLDDMAGFAPLAEILAAVHVKAHVRLFMN